MTRNPTTPSQWITCPKPGREKTLRLFCFPYAGGSPLIFRDWPNCVPLHVEVCLVQLPGRGMRLNESPYTRLTSLVDALVKDMTPYLDKPFVFFGHSMGAMISFELARALRREHGLSPQHLFISGRTAPQVSRDEPLTYHLPEPEFIDEVRRLNGTPKEVLDNPELMQLLIPLLRADFEVCQTYEYQPDAPLDCPITVIGGLQDSEVKRQNLELWREFTTSRFLLRMLPGDHFFLHTAQPLLLRVLSQELHQYVTSSTRV